MLSLHETVAMVNQDRGLGNDSIGARRQAAKFYQQVYNGAWWSRIWRQTFSRHEHLAELETILKGRRVKSSRYLGTQLVSIDRIRGSEGRSRDFDRRFRPLNGKNEARWVSVAAARFLEAPLPPVNLILVGDTYYVRDGHHRISVARAAGQGEIEAEVVAWEV